MANHILGATALSKPFGSGQKVVSVALRYDIKIDGASLSADAYAVENRTILSVFAANAPDATVAEATGGQSRK